MLSTIAHGPNGHRTSQESSSIISINDDQVSEIDVLSDLEAANLERRRSSRVSFHC